MRLEKQIYRLLWEYPTSYEDRTAALHHLFIINGNGYEWRDGELRTYGDTSKLSPFDQIDEWFISHIAQQKAIEGEEWNEEWQAEWQRRCDRRLTDRIAKTKLVRQEITMRVQSKLPLTHLYPLCQYGKVCNLPADIKEDWLAGAQEAVDLALMVIPESLDAVYLRTPEQQTKDHQRNQSYLQAAQARINELKIGRGLQ